MKFSKVYEKYKAIDSSTFKKCQSCKVYYIEDCPHLEVVIGGKNELPIDCWREDLVKKTAKPHLKNTND